ncbi:MAG: Gx transporter family protein [Eubacterium sp.]|nr:Gx transporter family protein [Eubacterium sp.]
MKQKQSPARRIAVSAMFIALAMIFSYVETLIPVNFGIPGIKLGLANLVIMVGLFIMKPGEVLVISVARILLVGFLFGNGASILYSLAGGLLSFLVMLLLIRFSRFSILGVSIAGGVSHNIGQLTVAALVVQNIRMAYYLPVLIVSGAVTGFLIGLLSGRIVPVLSRLQKS